MTGRSYTWYRDFALANLGYTDEEADEYARRRLDEDARRSDDQLELPTAGQPPRGQLGRDHDDWGGY